MHGCFHSHRKQGLHFMTAFSERSSETPGASFLAGAPALGSHSAVRVLKFLVIVEQKAHVSTCPRRSCSGGADPAPGLASRLVPTTSTPPPVRFPFGEPPSTGSGVSPGGGERRRGPRGGAVGPRSSGLREKLWRPQCPTYRDLTGSFIRKWEQELEDEANTGRG